MDTYLKNFGPRLRKHVEDRGTIESAVSALDVSRATLFNWFNREEPPPGREMIDRLRKYLGKDADWILDTVQKDDMMVQDQRSGFSADQSQTMRITPPHQLPAREPSMQEMNEYYASLLGKARLVPGGLFQLQRALKRFEKDIIDPISD